ncbi:EamA family transporter [Sulfitobacter mediterraneus]|uniref:EamA family transporter n=1 Tax=Sulfitobacter mediterraneus TaxID=83219 RepID=UPI001933F2C7|nr:EamA family transporter [Sulfitobacter mediterraneus]MBM1309993.1 EamA family transporter [Sulfitobacter mediterraneus]MBM1313877.1 EamA family transporter [Sulfitobacter mediterraneus]MBM1322237.1 EamA family transporter [Sulfitobacter mediterraneus]MBM1326149.1 EamA family transporter [Sulfitobacter mediterraneus]MBM1397495.1 EamA family transporter [Sulfitobacter mediterraneus]
MTRSHDLFLTALAPTIWGSSYIVTTQFLPNLDPLTISLLRALPAGLLLLLLVRQLPQGIWVPRMLVLGALNFAIFWSLLFFAAYRLPGGVAAVMGALQPFIVIFAARGLLGTAIRPLSLLAIGAGVLGVALLILTPEAKLDGLGVLAGIMGSASMALGTVLSRKWQPPVPALTFTAWQLTAGGLLLLPFAPFAETDWATLTLSNLIGLGYLGLIGAALTYVLWLRGIARLQPAAVSVLGLLSPISATVLGWLFVSETLTPGQVIGMVIVLASVVAGQYALRRPAADTTIGKVAA